MTVAELRNGGLVGTSVRCRRVGTTTSGEEFDQRFDSELEGSARGEIFLAHRREALPDLGALGAREDVRWQFGVDGHDQRGSADILRDDHVEPVAVEAKAVGRERESHGDRDCAEARERSPGDCTLGKAPPSRKTVDVCGRPHAHRDAVPAYEYDRRSIADVPDGLGRQYEGQTTGEQEYTA